MPYNPANYNAYEKKKYDIHGNLVEVLYNYSEVDASGHERKYSLPISRSDYEKRKWNTHRPTLAYDDYLKVLRPFIMSRSANNEIEQAFGILDFDNSGTVDFKEFAAFITITSPETTPEMVEKSIAKISHKSDNRLSPEAFRNFIIQGLGRYLIFRIPLY